MLSSNKESLYYKPSIDDIAEAIEGFKLNEFRAVWNIYTGNLLLFPKSSSVVFGVDLGIYKTDSDPNLILEKIRDASLYIEKTIIKSEFKNNVFYDIKTGILPIDTLPTTHHFYNELKEIVDRRGAIYA